MNENDLTELMRASRPTIGGEARQVHLASIASALREVPAPSRWRRLAVGSAVGLVLVGPVGLAAAASSALPGEPLYGTKRVVDVVVSLVDDDFAAGRRLSEAEWLLANGGSLEIVRNLLEDARRDVSAGSPLSARLDELWSHYLALAGAVADLGEAIDSDDDVTIEIEDDESDESDGLTDDADDSDDMDHLGGTGDSEEGIDDSDDSGSSDHSDADDDDADGDDDDDGDGDADADDH